MFTSEPSHTRLLLMEEAEDLSETETCVEDVKQN